MNKYILCAVAAVLIFGIALYPHKPSAKMNVNISENIAVVAKPSAGVIFPIDKDQSTIRWEGTKLFRTAGHKGVVKLREGFLSFINDSLAGGTIIVDMNSISITDTSRYSRETMDRLANHLRRAEFNTPDYPLAKFEITAATYLGRDSLQITGDMTIKDVTKVLVIPAGILPSSENEKHFYTEFSLDRYDWNIGKDASLLERNLVDREFILKIDLKAGAPGVDNQ